MIKLEQAIGNYLTCCEHQKKLSAKSVKAYATDLKQFCKYLASENIPAKTEISKFIMYLHNNFSPRSAQRKIASIRAFMNYLEYEEILNENPIKKIRTKFQIPKMLPRIIPLTVIENILQAAYQELQQAQTAYALSAALQNIVIIELLFATGLRVSELCSLSAEYIDLENGSIRIIGKGAKERILHIGNPEVPSIMPRYAEDSRARINETGCFFVNRLSSRISEQSVRVLIKRLCAKANVEQNIMPHMFRHSVATLLLEEDVDTRYIQCMLGHSSILTTQIYTQTTARKQRQILNAKHPRNRIVVKA
jgi:integrase/recombinase XerD